MNIRTKGILLVTVPLLFQFIFVGTLVRMQKHVEDLADLEKRDYEIAANINRLSQDFIGIGTTVVKHRRLAPKELEQRFTDGMKQAQDDADSLYAMLKSDPDLSSDGDELKRRLSNMVGILSTMVDQAGGYAPKIDSNFYHSHLPAAYRDIQDGLAALEQKLQQRRDANPLASANARDQLRLLVGLGLSISVLITVALAIFFTRNISDRLRTMESNTYRFLNHQPLLPPVSGSDELSNLDNIFRQMVGSINQAEARKSDFLQMISHDIRAPLMSLTATLSMVMKGVYGTLNETGHSRVQDAEDSADRIVAMINELLDVERLESGALPLNYTSSPAVDLIGTAMKNVTQLAENKQIKIDADEVPADLAVNADAKRVVQILTNLLANALKYSPEGSTIKVHIDDSGPQLNFTVTDQGPGIDKELQQTLFDRYVQVDSDANREQVGTGLGLAICKGLVEAHGGSIGVESEPGAGSNFKFSIPKEQRQLEG